MALLITIERHNEFLRDNIKGIKWVRSVTGCGLKQAKAVADALSADTDGIWCPTVTLRINDDTSALRLICGASDAGLYIRTMEYIGETKQDFEL